MNLINPIISRTSDKDLYKLCDSLNIKNVIVCRKRELKKYLKNKKINNFIINLDDVGNGSHWVAYYRPKNLYMDSYSQAQPLILKNAKRSSAIKELQSIDATDCGGLCCLWLYYVNFKSNKEYYSKFRDVY
jgi:hypothetical protein